MSARRTAYAAIFGARASSAIPTLRSHQLKLHRVPLRYVYKFCAFSVEQQAAAPHLDPSLEAVLRSHGVHDEIIMNFRCNDVLSQAVFVAFGRVFDLCPEGGFIHKREMAKVIASWKESRLQSETKAKVDAVARAHGEPVSYLPSEWVKILKTFKEKFGQRIPEYYLPAQCYFEAFEEKVNEGNEVIRLRAEDSLHRMIQFGRSKTAPERLWRQNSHYRHVADTFRSMPKTVEAVAHKVSGSLQRVAPRQTSTARPLALQGSGRTYVAFVFGRAFEQEELCLPTSAGELRGNGGSRLEPLPRV